MKFINFLGKISLNFGNVIAKFRHPLNRSQIKIPIRTKITLPYLFLAVLLAVSAGFLISNIVLDTLEERFDNQLAEVGLLSSELMVAEETRLLENLRILTNTEGMADAVQRGDPDELRELAFGIVVNNKLDSVEFLDTAATPILTMRHNPGGLVEDYQFSAGGDSHQYMEWEFVSKVLKSEEDSLGDKFAGYGQADWGSFFYIAGPVYTSDNEIVGIILVGTQLQNLVNTLRSQTLGQITIYQFDGQPIVTSFPFKPEALEISTAEHVIAEQDLAKSRIRDVEAQREIAIIDLEYTEVLAPWEVRGDADVGILGAALQKNFFVNPSSLTSLQLGALVSAALFLIIMIGIHLANLITRPLLELVNASQAVADGNLNVNVDLDTNDEIKTLAHSFNTMIANLNRSRNDILQAYDSALMGWSKALELRDKETEGHTQRVTELTVALARELGIGDEELVNIRRGAILHDIGKMGVPDAILHKPGRLDDVEWVIMKKHTVYAYEMLKDIRFLETALDIPRYHHENWDGKGYPYGLKGSEIPLAARIFSVVDVWDALTSQRAYKEKFSETESMRIIEEESGKKLDPAIVLVFRQFIEKSRGSLG